MPPNLQLVRQWLERAQRDLGYATLGHTDPRYTAEVGFHCQQAVEKSLKAYLTWREIDFAWSHGIHYLLELCATSDEAFRGFDQSADPLTQYAVRFRYPRPDPDPTLEDVRGALMVARDVYGFVLQRIPPEAHPTP